MQLDFVLVPLLSLSVATVLNIDEYWTVLRLVGWIPSDTHYQIIPCATITQDAWTRFDQRRAEQHVRESTVS